MTLKSITAKILQITGLITAITGCVKSVIDLLGVMQPKKAMIAYHLDKIGPAPPPPPPPTFMDQYGIFIIGPSVIVLGLVIVWIANRVRRD